MGNGGGANGKDVDDGETRGDGNYTGGDYVAYGGDHWLCATAEDLYAGELAGGGGGDSVLYTHEGGANERALDVRALAAFVISL